MIQLIIMKKYNLFFGILAALSALLLSSCEEVKGTRTVVYSERPPQLTVMTQTTTTPADTYSEYMATYSTTETTTTNYFAAPMNGVAADTAVRNPAGTAATAVTTVPTDTAAASPNTETASPPGAAAETTGTVSAAEEASENNETSVIDSVGNVSESTSVSSVTAYVPQLPAPDTAVSNSVSANAAVPNPAPGVVQADTAHSRNSGSSDDSGEDANNSNGGTD